MKKKFKRGRVLSVGRATLDIFDPAFLTYVSADQKLKQSGKLIKLTDEQFEKRMRDVFRYQISYAVLEFVDERLRKLTNEFVDSLDLQIRKFAGGIIHLNEDRLKKLVEQQRPIIIANANDIFTDLNVLYESDGEPDYKKLIRQWTGKRVPRDFGNAIKNQTYRTLDKIQGAYVARFGNQIGARLNKRFVEQTVLANFAFSNFLLGGKAKKTVSYDGFKKTRANFARSKRVSSTRSP